MENAFREQQAKAKTVKSHNEINIDDITMLYKLEWLSKSHKI